MTYSKFDPGCGCCNSFECRTQNYPREQFPLFGWSGFPINEGAFTPDLSKQPLALDQKMQAPSDVLSSSSEAWYHLIRFEGDIDLEWNGLQILVRPQQGFISTDGIQVPVIPMAHGILSPTDSRRTEIMLIVTPDWLGVVYFPVRLSRFSMMTHRGAIQIIDRQNDPSIRDVTLTMRSPLGAVVTWVVSDMSVQIRNDKIVLQCQRPPLPGGTELLQISQTSVGFNTFFDPTVASFMSGTSRIPKSFATSGNGLFSFTTGPRIDFEWNEFGTAAAINPLPSEIASLYSYRLQLNTGSLPTPNLRQIFLIVSGFPTTIGSRIGFHQRVVWRRQTIANPYPKPESLTLLRFQDIATLQDGDEQFLLTEYDSHGRADASVSAVAQSTVTWTTY